MNIYMNISLTSLVLVFIGGGAGSVARFLVSSFMATALSESASRNFPLPTLCINVAGSFCIGIVVALCGDRVSVLSASWRLLLAVGFCGGFTTFSTFSLEMVQLLQSGRAGAAMVYAASSLALCVAGTAAGLSAVYWWWKNYGV
jgi:fluoride exporter